MVGALGTSGTKSSRLGMEHLGTAGSGEVKTCREGDIVEAGAEVILNNLSPTGLIIYPLGLEECVAHCHMLPHCPSLHSSHFGTYSNN